MILRNQSLDLFFVPIDSSKTFINSKKEHLENQNLLKSSTVSFMLRHSSATEVFSSKYDTPNMSYGLFWVKPFLYIKKFNVFAIFCGKVSSIVQTFQWSWMSGQPHIFPVKCLENQETFKTWVEKATCDIQCLGALSLRDQLPILSWFFSPNKKNLKVKWGGHMSVKHSPVLVRLSLPPSSACWPPVGGGSPLLAGLYLSWLL